MSVALINNAVLYSLLLLCPLVVIFRSAIIESHAEPIQWGRYRIGWTEKTYERRADAQIASVNERTTGGTNATKHNYKTIHAPRFRQSIGCLVPLPLATA